MDCDPAWKITIFIFARFPTPNLQHGSLNFINHIQTSQYNVQWKSVWMVTIFQKNNIGWRKWECMFVKWHTFTKLHHWFSKTVTYQQELIFLVLWANLTCIWMAYTTWHVGSKFQGCESGQNLFHLFVMCKSALTHRAEVGVGLCWWNHFG